MILPMVDDSVPCVQFLTIVDIAKLRFVTLLFVTMRRFVKGLCATVVILSNPRNGGGRALVQYPSMASFILAAYNCNCWRSGRRQRQERRCRAGLLEHQLSRISAISRAGLPRATHFNTSHSRAARECGVLRALRERPIKRMPGEVLFTRRRVIQSRRVDCSI